MWLLKGERKVLYLIEKRKHSADKIEVLFRKFTTLRVSISHCLAFQNSNESHTKYVYFNVINRKTKCVKGCWIPMIKLYSNLRKEVFYVYFKRY